MDTVKSSKGRSPQDRTELQSIKEDNRHKGCGMIYSKTLLINVCTHVHTHTHTHVRS